MMIIFSAIYPFDRLIPNLLVVLFYQRWHMFFVSRVLSQQASKQINRDDVSMYAKVMQSMHSTHALRSGLPLTDIPRYVPI